MVLGKSMGSKSCERLLNEAKRYTDRARCRKNAGFEAECIDGNLYDWRVKIFHFFDGSTVNRDLQDLREHQGVDHFLLSFRFTTDYPLKPPSVRVIYPRVVPGTSGGAISVGGTVHLKLFSYEEWSPVHTISSIVIHVKNKLVETNTRIYIDNPIPYSEEEATSALVGFYTSYVCNRPGSIERPDLNYGGKVLLPASALQEILKIDSARGAFSSDSPLVFELSNPATYKSTYAGVMEFLAKEKHVTAPDWLMKNLEIEEGEMINVRLVTLPKGTFVKFKTHDSHFFVCYPDPKPIFETVLRNFAALSQGDHIDIAFDSITYHFEVLETKPANAIDINNVDIEVEFQRTMTKEEQEREAAQLEQKREEVKVSDAQADHWSRLDGEGVELQFATVLCKNCQRRVSAAAFATHSAFCERNNVCCMKCGIAIKVSEKEKHDREHHAQVECEACGKRVEMVELTSHTENYCSQRKVPCHYCSLMVKASELDEHQEYCGTRTEVCETCHRCIMYKDLPQHIGTNCKYPPTAVNASLPGASVLQRTPSVLSYLGLGGWWGK